MTQNSDMQQPRYDPVRIIRKGPVAWLNLRLLFDTGKLAAISSATDSRSPRREVLAALDPPSDKPPYFDYSDVTQNDFWIDYVADLGDGFDATHSIAWLVGRDRLGLGKPGEKVAQPLPGDCMAECGAEEFADGAAIPAGRITIFGGDLVYPFATQTEYEDRTVRPYHAARPWQLTPEGEDDERHIFSIPGNHDWYDGLGAFVQRFCQPDRWMGCWNVRQRRSYFAIRLPHRTWLWGVDLATGDDFDAPQLEYFQARARDLGADEQVILCVPKPAWFDREVAECDRAQGASSEPDTKKAAIRSWEAFSKVDEISKLVERRRGDADGPRIRAVLSGDLHHYSRYATSDNDAEARHFITCGGGGAYLLGTEDLPNCVELGRLGHAHLKERFPPGHKSRDMCWGALKLPFKHWMISLALGLVMMALVWLLESAAPASILEAMRQSIFSHAFASAFFGAIFASPIHLVLTCLAFAGFVAFALSGRTRSIAPVVFAGLLHGVVQLFAALMIAAFALEPTLESGINPILMGIMFLLWLSLGAWLFSGLILAGYLLLSNAILGIHWQEVFSSQAIEDWKCFLRIRVGADGISIYPIGLEKVARDWVLADGIVDTQSREETEGPEPGNVGKAMDAVKEATRAVKGYLRPTHELDVPRGATHLFLPDPPLAPELIENVVQIPHLATAKKPARRKRKSS